MFRGKSVFALLATIFNLIIPLIDGAYLEERPASNDLAEIMNNDMAEIMSTAFPLKGNDPPAVSGTLTAAPPNCTPWAKCILFFQDINVFYWPEASQNTACLSDSQAPYDHPSIPNIQSPSIYAIIPSIRASDGCNTVGMTFAGLTTSFPPGALSTIGLDSSTSSFNFGDLPCPPADKGWHSFAGRYAPQLAPGFLFNLDPAFANCTPGWKQGIDPYSTLRTANKASGPGGVGCTHGRHCAPNKRAVERQHLLPWAPQKTAAPTS